MPPHARDLIALGALVLGGLAYMKVKKETYKWIWVAIAAICVLAMIFWPESETNSPSIKTSGDNSPATIQTATTSGSNSPATLNSSAILGNNNTAVQTGPNSTVNIGNTTGNNGITLEEMEKMLHERFDTPNLEMQLTKAFPNGYELVGVANGKFSFVPRFNQFKFDADWDNTTFYYNSNGVCLIYFSKFVITYPNGSSYGLDNMTINYPDRPNVEIRDPVAGLFWVSVLDFTNKVFVIGFR